MHTLSPELPFSATSRVWREVAMDKCIVIYSMNHMLNHALNFSDYGLGIEVFNFTVIIEPREFFPTKFRYVKKKKRMDAEVRMDYQQAMDASLDEFKSLVANTYLQAIDLLATKKIPDFDMPHFRHDVVQLFEQKGWLVAA
ncbi:MAG TPA: Imm44 family immunity protein [Saprospiraceae bacterium]|nr:Imm44 family immunity protein [Saprospiraceae bacterium]HMQ84307.1 Imm44 family immunity protein [Saprospiraceae bacterium]